MLAALDALASFPLPAESRKDLPAERERLNALWRAATPPAGARWGMAKYRRGIWAILEPALTHQEEFNAAVVRILNGQLDESARLDARVRELAGALVRYLQHVLPIMDARDRMATALATTRAELILEAFDRRLEALGRRLEGLLALRDRVETVSEETRAIRASLASAAPSAPVAAAAAHAADDAAYVAFENRFRGDPDEIRERLRSYVPRFEGLAPVLDLGSGRGEFLELLKEAGIAARGVESNAQMVQKARGRGLDVSEGDLLAFLRAQKDASLGGVFAAQVAEHLPPAVLQAAIREAHRALRPGGLLILETVNPRSLVGFLEVYNRDLTHERPLHPETLSFIAAAQGFSDVRVELRSPVDAASRLQPVPSEGLPSRAAQALNENIEQLNALLYGHQEYALLARR